MKSILVSLTLFAVLLAGCDTSSSMGKSVESSTETSINNSDSRKQNFQLPTSSDQTRFLQKVRIANSVMNSFKGSSIGLSRTAAETPKIAVLTEPVAENSSSNFRVFFHTETDGNADHVRAGGINEAINGSSIVSSRTSPNLGYKGIYAKIGSYWSLLGYDLDQGTGITGLRYAGINPSSFSIPKPQNYSQAPFPLPTAFSYSNVATPGLNMWFKPISMTTLPRLSMDYIVLRLSSACPENGYPFSQAFDDEDTNNQDTATFNLTPGFFSRPATYTQLAFCFVPKATSNPSSATALSFGKFGIFANPNSSEVSSSEYTGKATLVMDSEDTDFAGFFDWEGLLPEYQARVQNIMIISSAAQTPFLTVSNFNIQSVGVLGSM